uniref:Anaphase-promoting complex subunit 4 WD40 domain-containing protein n=1 Tax=Trichuris muris TaxID=70415 RepID=A0A5S6QVF4_TRIMR
MVHIQHTLKIKRLKNIEKISSASCSFDADHGGGSFSLITISRSFGIICAAWGSEVLFLETKRLTQSDTVNSADLITRRFSLPSNVVWIQCNSDGSQLAVCFNNNDSPLAYIYSMKTINQGICQPICQIPLSDEAGDRLLSLKWNPGEAECLLSLCKNAGVRLYKIDATGSLTALGRIAGGSSILCVDWSPKGKQFVVGRKDGSIVQYKTSCQIYKTFNRPSNEMLISAVDIAWVLPREFFVNYSTRLPENNCTPVLAKCSKERPTELQFTEFAQCLLLPPTSHGVRRCFLSCISSVPLVLCSASPAGELRAFVRDKSDVWHYCETVQLDEAMLSIQKSGSSRDLVLGLIADPNGEMNAQRAGDQSGSSCVHSVVLFTIDATLTWLQLTYGIDDTSRKPLSSLISMVSRTEEIAAAQQPPSKESLPGRAKPAFKAISCTPQMFRDLISSYERKFDEVRNEALGNLVQYSFSDTDLVRLAGLEKMVAEESSATKSLATTAGNLNSITMKQFSSAELLRLYSNKQFRAKIMNTLTPLPSELKMMENIRNNSELLNEKLSKFESWLGEGEKCSDALPKIMSQEAKDMPLIPMIKYTIGHLERLTAQAEKKVGVPQGPGKIDLPSVHGGSCDDVLSELSMSMDKLSATLKDEPQCFELPKEGGLLPFVGERKSFEEQLMMVRFAKRTQRQEITVVPEIKEDDGTAFWNGFRIDREFEPFNYEFQAADNGGRIEAKSGLEDIVDGVSAGTKLTQSPGGKALNADLESGYLSTLSPPLLLAEELAKCAESLSMDEVRGLSVLESDYSFAKAPATARTEQISMLKNGRPSVINDSNAVTVSSPCQTKPLGEIVTSKPTLVSEAEEKRASPNVLPVPTQMAEQKDSMYWRFHWNREQGAVPGPTKQTVPEGKGPSFATATRQGNALPVLAQIKKEPSVPSFFPPVSLSSAPSVEKNMNQPKSTTAAKELVSSGIVKAKDVAKQESKALFSGFKSSSTAKTKTEELLKSTVTTTVAAGGTAQGGGSIFANLNTQSKQTSGAPGGGSLFSVGGSAPAKAAPNKESKDGAKENVPPPSATDAKGEKPITFSFGTSAVQAALAKKNEENETEMESSDITTTDSAAKSSAADGLPNFSFKLEDHQTATAPTGGFFSGLGAKPKPEAAAKNIFAGGMSLGTPTSSASSSLFGAPSSASPFAGAFGSSQAGQSSFGTSSLFSSTPSQPTAFGMSSATPAVQAPTAPGGFGSQPTFGGNIFGSQPVFGGTNLFGSATTFPQTSPSAGFSAFAKSNVPTFGALAGGSKGSPPSLGTSGASQSDNQGSSSFTQWRG